MLSERRHPKTKLFLCCIQLCAFLRCFVTMRFRRTATKAANFASKGAGFSTATEFTASRSPEGSSKDYAW
jgi:hypothetical protein